MRAVARALLFVSLAFASAALVPAPARASVSIAITFDSLVRTSSAVAVVTPIEEHSVWEDNRIYTYTLVHVDTPVAGELAADAQAWVRTMGGVVGRIGQVVDGEAVLPVGRPSMLFLHPGPQSGFFEVTARAQGQYGIKLDPAKKPLLIKSSGAGVLFAPHGVPPVSGTLAAETLHGRTLDDAAQTIASAWGRLHAH